MGKNVSEILSEKHNIAIPPGGRGKCPSCGSEKSFNVMKHGKFGKCFRPSCGFSIRAGKQNLFKESMHAILSALMDEFKSGLAIPEGESKPTTLLGRVAFEYLTNDRLVHPDVVRDALIGVIPADFDPARHWLAQIEKLREIADAAKSTDHSETDADESTESDDLEADSDNSRAASSKPGSIASQVNEERVSAIQVANRLEKQLEVFEGSTTKLSGWLVLATTDAHCNIVGFKFRLPSKKQKRFASYYGFAHNHGVFGANLFSNCADDDGIKPDSPLRSLIVTEGEFNALAIQSTIKRSAADPDSISYANVIALGSATYPDFATVKAMEMPVIIVHDNDEPGTTILKKAEENISFEACTTTKTEHGPECNDVDELVMKFPISQNGAKSAMRAIAAVLAGRVRHEMVVSDDGGGANTEKIIEALLSKMILIKIPQTDFHIYESGVFTPVHKDYVRSAIGAIRAKYSGKTPSINTILSALEIDPRVLIPLGESFNALPKNRYLINLDRGMLDPISGELLPHDPKYRSTTRIAAPYDPKAECPLWVQKLSEIVEDEKSICILQEFAGLLLVYETKFERAMILFGPQGSGKSTILNVIINMLGGKNVSSESLESLGEPFHAISTFQKLANISSETKSAELSNNEVFKRICSGEEITDSYKCKDRFSFAATARLIFSANSLPPVIDPSGAFFARLLLVSCPRSFRNTGGEDKNLKEKLAAEMSGVLNWSLAGLRRLTDQGGFTTSDTAEYDLSRYKAESNPVFGFVEEVCRLDPSAETRKNRLYELYADYSKRNGYRSFNASNFHKNLKAVVMDMGGNIEGVRHREDGRFVQYVQGIEVVCA